MRNHVDDNNFKNSGTSGKTWTQPESFFIKRADMIRNRKGESKQFVTRCHKCSKEFTIIEYDKKFCSRSCANSRKVSDETKKKISESLTKIKTDISFCIQCKKCFPSRKRKYCSKKCRSEQNLSKYTDLELYRKFASFNFNLSDYPNRFDFSLIEKYGWYKAKNRGDNPNGITRDHIISVKYGFDNNIPTWIISHPANCQLKRHKDNVSKGTKCDLTLEALLDKIKKWQ